MWLYFFHSNFYVYLWRFLTKFFKEGCKKLGILLADTKKCLSDTHIYMFSAYFCVKNPKMRSKKFLLNTRKKFSKKNWFRIPQKVKNPCFYVENHPKNHQNRVFRPLFTLEKCYFLIFRGFQKSWFFDLDPGKNLVKKRQRYT